MYEHVSVEGALRTEDLAADGAGVGLRRQRRGVVRSDVDGELVRGGQLLLANGADEAAVTIL